MRNIFKLFAERVRPAYLGVDIGTTSIKAVEVRGGARTPEVINYAFLESGGYLARVNDALQTSTLKLFERETVELLGLLLGQLKPGTQEAVASLPVFAAFTTVLDFPDMKPADLEKAIPFQAKRYVPLPLSEVAIEWLKVGEFRDENGFAHIRVLLISVPQEHIKKYRRIFKLVGLDLVALEVESVSMARLFGGVDPTPTLVLDIGSRSTNIMFLGDGRLRFSVQSDFAGASLTQALASSLGIHPLRAEELKKQRGIAGTGPNYELSTVMLPFLDAILNEIRNAWVRYTTQFPESPPIERIILSGGTANLLGIEEYFRKEFSIPVVKAAPFEKFSCASEMEPFIPEISPVLSVALGLTLGRFQ